MLKKIKKQRKAILLISLFFLFFAFNKALGRNLEISYPGSGFSTIATPINVYVRYIFGFLTTTVGVIALLFLILGGLNYLASAGNPEEVSKAKKRIFSALLGLLITLGSFLILWNINYSFTVLQEPTLNPVPEARVILKNEIYSPILFCEEEIDDINILAQNIDDTTDIAALFETINNVKEHCVFIELFENFTVPSEWREPEIIYILPDLEKTPNQKIYYGAYFLELRDGELGYGQVVYNLTDEVKMITPMDPPIYYAAAFATRSWGDSSYEFPRSVKLHKYIDREKNLRNQLEKDPEDCGLSGDSTCYGPFSTEEVIEGEEEEEEEIIERPIREFFLKKNLTISSATVIPENLPIIVFFYPYNCGTEEEDGGETVWIKPSFDNGKSCSVRGITSSINKFQDSKITTRPMGVIVIAGSFGTR
ncbi:MAG: pilin [Candidatus Pacebacteria bacterium]|nr:pilin [Candidatus Paceibacterota bacterium]MDD3729151.1 pilin [Candidatus Paceibacterota bacterium]MDD5446151.1 pilin [Candidatus Paceibacterota bacterium]